MKEGESAISLDKIYSVIKNFQRLDSIIKEKDKIRETDARNTRKNLTDITNLN